MKKNKSFKMPVFIFLGLVLVLVLIAVSFLIYFLSGNAPVQDKITWGVDFSQSQSEYLGFDWKENYLAILDDLGVKNLKLHTNWNWVEGKKDNFFYDDIDWQIKEAEKRDVKIIYVLGMKTGRWPECHIPKWAENISEDRQQAELLKYITEIVLRYKDSKAIAYWQVENEPLFKFGVCPAWYYRNDEFLKTEVALVKSLDPSRQVIISDSGEQSSWNSAAKTGDIVGTTLYRSVWADIGNTFSFQAYSFLSPVTYYKKAQFIQKKYSKKVICVELQAEPWASKPFLEAPMAEQEKSMNPAMFQENIEFAQKTGLDTFYLWGAEWWYWMKEKNRHPEIWQEAKQLFQQAK